MRSTKQWIRLARPIWMYCKRSSLLAVLGLFVSVHLLSAAQSEPNFANTSLSSANCQSAAGSNLDVAIENSESSVSMDVVLRDASHALEQSRKSRVLSAEKMSGLRRFTRPGTTGPPSDPINNRNAA